MRKSIILSALVLCLLSSGSGVAFAALAFTERTAAAGFNLTVDIGGWHGTYVADYDGDGDEDLFMTSHGIGQNPDTGRNALFQNRGNGTFVEVAQTAGVDGGLHGRYTRELHGASWFDFDNDGDLDLFMPNTDSDTGDTTYRAWDELYRNNGNGTFANISGALNFPHRDYCRRGAAAGDFNKDGFIDLFVVDMIELTNNNHVIPSPYKAVYMNQGGTSFSWERRGISYVSWSEGVTTLDYNGDGNVDILVADEGSGGGLQLWRNDGTGNFTNVTASVGLPTGISLNGSVIAGDIDNDGDEDIYCTAGLYRNNGGSFTRVATFGGAEHMFFADLDNDGDLDLVSGGIFLNNGNGTFGPDVSSSLRVTCEGRGGMAFDADGDGDLDLIFNRSDRDSPYLRYYRNDLNSGTWLKVKTTGPGGQAAAPGAKVWVYDQGHLGDTTHLVGHREVITGSGFVSAPSPVQHFGLDGRTEVDVRVRYVTGRVEERLSVPAQSTLDVVTAIELSSFTVTGEDSTVDVEWETKTEISNLGFNLYRGNEKEGTYTKLNGSIIPGLISSVTGKRYSFTDADVIRGELYCYKLEDIDLEGRKTMHGPVCVDWDRDGIPDDIDPTPGDPDPVIPPSPDPPPGPDPPYDPETYSVTVVTLHELRARQAEGGVQIEWRTGHEVNNLGFHVYREENGGVYRLTPDLIAGSAFLAGSGTPLTAGFEYRWWDMSVISDQSLAISDQSSVISDQSSPLAPRDLRLAGLRYWLEDIDLNGVRTMHGPVEIQTSVISHQSSVSSDQLSAKYERPGYLSELGKKLEERYEEAWRVQEIRERLRTAPLKDRHAFSVTRGALALEARASNLDPQVPQSGAILEAEGRSSSPSALRQLRLPPTSSTAKRDDPAYAEAASAGRPPTFSAEADPQAGVLQKNLSGRRAVKLLVKEEGWHRVSRAALVGAGLNASVNPQLLQVYAEGREIPIRIVKNTQGEIPSWKAIDFYGTGLDTQSTDTRVYWLVEGSAAGQRVRVSSKQGGTTGSLSFPYTVERKDRTFYFPALRNGEESNWFGPAIYQPQEPVDQILEVRNIDLSAPEDALLEIGVQGAADASHVVRVYVNDLPVGTLSWEGQVPWTGVFPVPHADLLEGENLVTLEPLSGDMIVSLVDYIRLTYSHTYHAYGDELKCQAQGGTRVSIDGFSTRAVAILDVTNERDVIRVLRKITSYDAGDGTVGYRATFTAPGKGERTLLALTEQQFRTPAEIQVNRPSSWRQVRGRDFLIVSHKDFTRSLEPLKARRRSEGFSVGVVDMEDVYDEFSFGGKNPRALKDFLRYVNSHWSLKPKYVLLVGDASYDPRDYFGYGNQDYVPTKLVDTFYLETASDDWFVDFDDDGLPDLAIGRLPVQTVEEADAVISKIVSYAQSNPISEALLVADQVGQGDFDFEGSNDEVGKLLPTSLAMRKVYRGQYGSDAEAKAALLTGINQGPLLVNYMGHGSVGIWRGDILTPVDAEALANATGFPFFVNMTCLNGFFQAPERDSLAEALIKRPQGGAVAVWTSSGLTVPGAQALMDRELMRLLFGEGSLSVGEAARRAKAATTDADVRRTWILFGDPSMKVKME